MWSDRLTRVMRLGLALLGGAAAADAARADLLADIKSKGEIVVATEARFAPFEYVEDGKIVGYGPDLMKLIFDKHLPGVKVNQLDLPWQGILPGLAAGKWDVVITGVTITKERSQQYTFSTPIAEATVGVLKATKDDSIQKPEDMAGKVVGSQAGSAQLQVLQAYDAKLKESGEGVAEIKEYVAFDEAYADLAAGRIQAVAQSGANAASLIKTRSDVFQLLPETIGPKTYFGWAVRKDENSASLMQLITTGLLELKQSGEMAKLQEKWMGFTTDLPDDPGEPTM